MNINQKNTAVGKPNLISTNANQKDRVVPGNEGAIFSLDHKSRDNDSKKKINRFFAGLPFNPEP